MYNTQEIATRIKLLAKSKGIPLKDMLSDLQMGINVIAHLSKGQQISYLAFCKFADYLDCSVDYLLGRTEDPAAHKKILPVRKDDLRDGQTTTYEQLVLAAYRAKPEMQTAVNTLLGIAAQPTIGDDMAHTIAAGEAVYGKTRTTDAK